MEEKFDPSQEGSVSLLGHEFVPLTKLASETFPGLHSVAGPHWQFQVHGGPLLLWSEGEGLLSELWAGGGKFREFQLVNFSL